MNSINRTLLTMLNNQAVRTSCTFEGLNEEAFTTSPGGDCKSIREIGQHLLGLRQFKLSLLGSRLVNKADEVESTESLFDLSSKLEAATARVHDAIMTHDPDDWYHIPEKPREGPWGEEPTISRFVRPLNDFTNHLGSIRAIRRILGQPAGRTQ